MYQLHYNKLPEVFYDCFTKISAVHDHYTRQKDSSVYFLPQVNKTFSQNQLSYRGTKFWYELNIELKNLGWIRLKKMLKKNI